MDRAERIDTRSVSVLDEAVWRAWRQNNRRRDARAAVTRVVVIKGSCIAGLLASVFLAFRSVHFGLFAAAFVAFGAGVVAQQACRRGVTRLPCSSRYYCSFLTRCSPYSITPAPARVGRQSWALPHSPRRCSG